eukprot:RCo031424
MTQKQLQEFQRRLDAELNEFKEQQKLGSKLAGQRSQMTTQLNENEMVKQELVLIQEGSQIYKLIGPVLVSQDKEDAMAVVEKRLEYLNGEISRLDKQIKDVETKQDQHRERIMEIQQQAQAAVQKQQQQQHR